MDIQALLKLHKDIPREGPGSDQATRRALRLLPELSPMPVVLDAGCGPGKQTLVLAEEMDCRIIAIDLFDQFLDQLRVSALERGLSELIQTRVQSMDALTEPEESVDLIWAEGSIYIVGFEKCLKLWRPILKPDGFVVASELTWLTDNPDREARDFWETNYPEMSTIKGNVERAGVCGYMTLDHFILDEQDWWREYLTPLEARMESLENEAAQDPALAARISEQRMENRIVEKYHGQFGYVFYVMQKR